MYIGIDLGGTKIAAALADKKGLILEKITEQTIRTDHPRDILKQLTGIIKKLSLGSSKKIKKVGIGLPGQIDEKGKIFNVPNIPALKNVYFVKELKKLCPQNYVLENDANAAALAELKFGSGKKYEDFIYLTISTGIGAGIILNKKIYRGVHGAAGEVGHTIILPNSQLKCGCGNKGCWETLGSGTALINMAKAKILNKEKTLITELVKNDLGKITGNIIKEAAEKGDELAKELFTVNAFYNAVGITNLVNIFDPKAIIIGGGLSFNGKYFFEPLTKCLKIFKLLNSKNSIKILKAGCQKDSGLLGALALVTDL
jgi:glucokinase